MNQQSFSSFIGKWRFNESDEQTNSVLGSVSTNKSFYKSKVVHSNRNPTGLYSRTDTNSSVTKKRNMGSKFTMLTKESLASTKGKRSATTTRSRKSNKSRGLTAQTSVLASGKDKVLCSIFESPKVVNPRIGISFFNLSTGEMSVSEYIDSQIFIRTLHNLQIYEPVEIILPSTSFSPTISKLCSVIKYHIQETVKVTETKLKFFDYKTALEIIAKHCVLNKEKEQIKVQEFYDKEYGLASMASCYDHYIKNNYANCQNFQQIRLKYKSTEKTALIDSSTINSLELVENSIDPNEMSFFKFLNHTVTKMGKRMLRNNILQPLTDLSSIEMRLLAVKQLLGGTDEHDDLKNLRICLRECHDLDAMFIKLLSINNCAIKSTEKINFVIFLKTALEKAKEVFEILNSNDSTKPADLRFNNELLLEIKNICGNPDLQKILDMISIYINDDCRWASTNLELQNQKTYAIKSGSNGLLDVSRNIYQSLIDEVMKEVEDLSTQHELNILHHFESSRGFYLRIKKQEYGSNYKLPCGFVNVYRKNKTYIEFSSLKIIKLNARLFEVISEIALISESIVQDLLLDIVKHISSLFMLSEGFAMLDFLCCLAIHVTLYDNYCQPDFSKDKLFVKDGRHPVMDKIVKGFVANNVICNRSNSAMTIVTGCNTSGKSVYLKQIVLLNILAQIGSYVPASYGCFPIFDKFHCRLCTDSIEINSSSFAAEMKEMAYFLDDVNDKTLLIIDELGRGSSIGDGFSICLATAEYLIAKKCTAFLSTHFDMIPQVLKVQPLVQHLHMVVEIGEAKLGEMKMTYKAENSKASGVANYGLKIVSKFFGQQTISESFRIADLFQAQSLYKQMQTNSFAEHVKKAVQIKQINNLVSCLEELLHKNEQLDRETIEELQRQFILRFEE